MLATRRSDGGIQQSPVLGNVGGAGRAIISGRETASKNLALAAGAVALFYLWNQLQGEAGLSLTDLLFERAD